MALVLLLLPLYQIYIHMYVCMCMAEINHKHFHLKSEWEKAKSHSMRIIFGDLVLFICPCHYLSLLPFRHSNTTLTHTHLCCSVISIAIPSLFMKWMAIRNITQHKLVYVSCHTLYAILILSFFFSHSWMKLFSI